MAEEFVYTSLSLSPVSATAVGYHQHGEASLDRMLDDLSAEGIANQRQFYLGFRDRLAKTVNPDGLTPEDRADYDLIQDQIALNLLEFDEIQSYRHNPTVYVELIGNAMFNPHVLEYAPKAERLRHIIARLERVPAFLDQAKKNLADSPEIWTTVAVEENDGNIGLIDKQIRPTVPPELSADYDRAARPALEALRAFQDYLKKDLVKRAASDWRLGADKYKRKFRYVLATDLTPDQVLANAEADLKAVQARMLELAGPLHEKMYPGQRDRSDANRVISEVLARIADRHSRVESYIPDAKAALQEARDFVRTKGLLALPPRDNLQVIETPEFMRGIYAVGGFMSAPALEPQLGAFYWITPIPRNWDKKRIDSKLREYNFFKLKLLTIHEAMPGHYVQLEYANDIQPKTRRVLRAVFGNGPYVEGWAQYATQMMLDAGFLDNAPEVRLTFQKEELRVLANAILDIRLQTMEMTDQQALDLMEKETFQEHEEAAAKLRRAKLSSCQLPTYLVGWHDWIRVREHYKQAKGGAYKLTEFNEQALKAGALPLPVLARLLTGKPL
ncbi:MAG: DUF885 domain-containing protein [Acidobacteria bacterium]|nr:DUF885 domain-containing protein [Acidobacteriota bacterium]